MISRKVKRISAIREQRERHYRSEWLGANHVPGTVAQRLEKRVVLDWTPWPQALMEMQTVLNWSTLVLRMRTEHTTGLADLLFGRTRGAVLALLYGHTDESFYTRQIAREVNGSVGAIQRELETLAKIGLIKRSSVGNQVFYQVNKDAPVFAEMRALVQKTVGAFGILHSALKPLANQIVTAFVYGSVARQQETAQSDIDVMIVGKAPLEDVLSRLSDIDTTLGRIINPTVYSVSEFRSKVASGNHFLNAVLKGEKVFLLGDESELRKVARVRMVKTRTHKSQ